MTTSLAAFSILALTVTLSLTRPKIRNLEFHHSHAAILGATLCLTFGVVPPALALHAIRVLLYPVITIISLMVITLIAEHAGVFETLARRLVRHADGDGRRLFRHLFFTGTLAGTVFTNDAAVLILTPLVLRIVDDIDDAEWSHSNRLVFYFAVLYVANLVGALVISNPINIIVAALFDIGFLEYAKWMVFPAVVSVLASYAGLVLFFRRTIPRTFRVNAATSQLQQNRREFVVCSVVLVITVIAFFTEGATGIPTWFAAMSGAVVLCALQIRRGTGNLTEIVRGVGWDVIIFVVGIFIVAYGLRAAGVTHVIGDFIQSVASRSMFSLSLVTGFTAAVCSALMNNHPTANIMAMIIEDLALPANEAKMLAFAALIGGDLGPKMLPIGSLAALLWFRLLRDRGITVSYWIYIKVGIPVTLCAVLLSLLALNVEFALSRASWR